MRQFACIVAAVAITLGVLVTHGLLLVTTINAGVQQFGVHPMVALSALVGGTIVWFLGGRIPKRTKPPKSKAVKANSPQAVKVDERRGHVEWLDSPQLPANYDAPTYFRRGQTLKTQAALPPCEAEAKTTVAEAQADNVVAEAKVAAAAPEPSDESPTGGNLIPGKGESVPV